MSDTSPGEIGFAPEEVTTRMPTRSARLKWVVAVQEDLPAGQAVNAAACAAAATGQGVFGLLGPDSKDAEGSLHPGLPWAGCTILTATAEQLVRLRTRAAASEGVYVVDMPTAAQQTRIYDEYLHHVATMSGSELDYAALSIVGPRNRIAKMVHGLPLMP